MVLGIERLRRARELLDHDGRPASDPEDLIEAAGECWSAAIDAAAWPIDLRVRATMLQRSMFRYGMIRATVERMDAAERDRLRREILDLADAAERIAAGGG
ncbi:MAG TPA: hypothetical protein VF170_19295 [Planctomycetaceae bacterium]